MDYDLLTKVITVVIGAIGAGKLMYDLAIGKSGRMRDEYKFAKDFLQDVKSNGQLHPFLREKGYQAIAGDRSINADEIEYLLSLEGPERALRDYVLGRPYLEHLPEAGNLQITYRKKYKASWARRWRKLFYVLAYAVLAFLAFAPLLLSKVIFKTPGQMLVGFVVSASVFGPYAWFALKAGARIYRAEKLVEYQHKHTQRIVLSTSNNQESSPGSAGEAVKV
ncbi:hypothetical protein [Azonexus sp.]|uniref:hypothetical protein n=1 Tax=Azonexus sp. TaxID=1872668 RepID=UPI002836A82E|nr:hypothetical protein [Azonexus sp.]MDR1994628.1 hypothetical protein [Azonexus sp.]